MSIEIIIPKEREENIPRFFNAPLTVEDYWRAIVLRGNNVMSYKFALAKSLLNLKPEGGHIFTFDELARPYSQNMCEALERTDTQGTARSSRFLDACRAFNRGEISKSNLFKQTVQHGFNDVIDAFHVVSRAEVPTRFFQRTTSGIQITDHFSLLMKMPEPNALPKEVDARWRLVEHSWSIGVATNLLGITHNHDEQMFRGWKKGDDGQMRRVNVASAHDALNGYQKGICFYCFRPMSLTSDGLQPEVDHFFPHVLKDHDFDPKLVDGVWNLVLSCRDCNRGEGGKSDHLPGLELLERLYKRNEHLISSHNPLQQTIKLQAGATSTALVDTIQKWHTAASPVLVTLWTGPPEEFGENPF